MKRLLTIGICLVALAIAALPVSAQTRSRRSRTVYDNRYNQTQYDRQYDRRYDRNNVRYQNEANRTDAYYDQYYDDRSVWEKHRDKITTGGGALAGAIIGGLAGGKKGALIGAIAGGGGAAIYTYKVRTR